MTGAPARQNAHQDVIDPDSYKLGLASLSTSSVAHNSSFSALQDPTFKSGSPFTSLGDLLNLPIDCAHDFEREILMKLDQEPMEELINTITAELFSTEKTELINLLYDVDIFFNFHCKILTYVFFLGAST